MNELVLHQPPARSWGSPNVSPFCIKLETYLRIAEIPYRLAPFSRGQMPKGKIPYVEVDGKHLGDSQLIIEELERRLASEGKPALDAGLSARDAAIGHLVRRTLEEAFYFVLVYLRWNTDAGYAALRDEFKKFVPGFVVPLIRRNIKKKLHKQGTGRHTLDEAMAMGGADFVAIAELLGDGPFLFGERPRTADCAMFGFLDAILGFPVDSPLKARIASHGSLGAYRERIRRRWWKDLT